MPPKAEAPTKPKKEAPKELCGCGVDTYRPPPKGKKPPAPIMHFPGCQYQRTTCEAYPHLPPCEVCQYPCKFCAGKYRWCPHCYETQCKFRFQRVVIGVEHPKSLVVRVAVPPPQSSSSKKPPAPPPPPEIPCPPYRPTGLRPATLSYSVPKAPVMRKKKSAAPKKKT